MTVQDDRMWADVLDAHTPNAAEMAAAEAELQALGEVAPLPAEDVEALVEVAVKTPSVESRGVVGTVLRSRRFRQPLLRVAAAVLLLMAAAWVAREFVWPEEKNSFDTLDYASAIDLATQRDRGDNAYLAALWEIYKHCAVAADTLRQVATQVKEPLLAKKARDTSADLVVLLTNGPSARAAGADLRMLECAAIALREDAPLHERQAALIHVGELTKSGLTAMWLSPLESTEAIKNRQTWIEKILGKLPR